MKTFVLYLFSILWTIIGLSNSEQNICKEGAVEKNAVPESYISGAQISLNHISGAISFEAASSSISTYATKNDISVKENIKLKSQNKSATPGHRFYKLNSIHRSNTLSFGQISSESALYVLAYICRLNI